MSAIASRLYSAASHTDSVDLRIRNEYQVNGGDANIAGRTASLKANLRSTADSLNGTVIPAIDAAIANSQRNIDYLEEQERRRREEEERRRREEEEERRKREEEKERQRQGG